MKWITRRRPKIDRVACPWLIARFIDEQPEFLFVAPEDVLPRANETGAVPFDVEGVELSHDGPAVQLRRVSGEVRADRKRRASAHRDDRSRRRHRALDLAPECAGLLAISLGLSAMFDDDLTQLSHGFVMYDALYAWCRHRGGRDPHVESATHPIEAPAILANRRTVPDAVGRRADGRCPQHLAVDEIDRGDGVLRAERDERRAVVRRDLHAARRPE